MIIFVKLPKSFWKYLVSIWESFIIGIKRNPTKIAVYILLIPALVFGLFMKQHSNSISQIPSDYTVIIKDPILVANEGLFLFAGFFIFGTFIVTCLNAVMAMSYSSKPSIAKLIVLNLLTIVAIGFTFAYYKIYSAYSSSASSIPGTKSAILMSLSITVIASVFEVVGSLLAIFLFWKYRVIQEKRRLLKDEIVAELAGIETMQEIEED